MRDNVDRSSGKRNENLGTGLLIELRKSHRELYTILLKELALNSLEMLMQKISQKSGDN